MKTLFKSAICFSAVLVSFMSCSNETGEFADITDENIEFLSTSENNEWFIDVDEALILADQFMNREEIKTRSTETNRTLKSTSVIQSEEKNGKESNALMYIFNYTKGFTIVSTTKGMYPILAYSEDSSFEEDSTNIGLSAWMDCMKNTVEKIIEDPAARRDYPGENEPAVTKAAKFYDEIRYYKKVGPLLTTAWYQGYPYNMHTPTINGTKTPAGCVPIAIGQVVNYHRTLTGENINWTAINNNASSDLGNFINIISDGISMEYEQTYAYPTLCLPFNFFCYRDRIKNYLNGKGYNATWRDLGNQRPVTCPAIYEGFTANFIGTTNWFGGHWWVMDGYESWERWYGWGEDKLQSASVPDNNAQFQNSSINGQNPPLSVTSYLYLHFNWGWGGTSNGWFGVSSSYLDYSKSFKRLDISKK